LLDLWSLLVLVALSNHLIQKIWTESLKQLSVSVWIWVLRQNLSRRSRNWWGGWCRRSGRLSYFTILRIPSERQDSHDSIVAIVIPVSPKNEP
jgi:hypothetical protein